MKIIDEKLLAKNKDLKTEENDPYKSEDSTQKYLDYYTYKMPEHDVHTNDPIVTLMQVGPLCLQSKQLLFAGSHANSRKIFKCFSSNLLRLEAMLLVLVVCDDFNSFW